MADRPGNDADKHPEDARLRDLEERLARLTPRPQVRGPMASYDQAHVAWRMVLEIVAGIGLGCAIGYGLDYLLGTLPWMMIIFIMLGFVAGIKVMMRTAAELTNTPGPAPDADKRD